MKFIFKIWEFIKYETKSFLSNEDFKALLKLNTEIIGTVGVGGCLIVMGKKYFF